MVLDLQSSQNPSRRNTAEGQADDEILKVLEAQKHILYKFGSAVTFAEDQQRQELEEDSKQSPSPNQPGFQYDQRDPDIEYFYAQQPLKPFDTEQDKAEPEECKGKMMEGIDYDDYYAMYYYQDKQEDEGRREGEQ